jgi:CrcB protein
MLNKILLISIGGIFGALSRYFLSTYTMGIFQSRGIFPYGTLAVNLLGAFAIGVLWQATQGTPYFSQLWLLLAVGFMGAFTTFSSYALETYNMISSGQYRDAAVNMLANNIGCIFLVFAGIIMVKKIKGA